MTIFIKSLLLPLGNLLFFGLNLILLTNINYVDAISDGTLQQVHILFRHGQRTPTTTYKNDPHINYKWPDGWGQLTKEGKRQMYFLGQQLRDIHYKDFMPVYYTNSEVKILSSFADRCLMSMELLLAGLFPPTKDQIWNENLLWQPIPVKYFPRNKDNIVVMRQACDRYDLALIDAFNSKSVQEINKQNQELYRYLSEHTGTLINDTASVESLHDTLELELLHNLTLPDWTRNISLNHLKELAAKNLALYTDTKYMKKMKGGVFLGETIKNMKNFASSNHQQPKLYLYAGHDTSLVNILRTLEVVDVIKPDFGAMLILELHNKTDDFLVKMIYKDNLNASRKELVLSNCDLPCSLDSFEVALKDMLPVDWEQECEIS